MFHKGQAAGFACFCLVLAFGVKKSHARDVFSKSPDGSICLSMGKVVFR